MLGSTLRVMTTGQGKSYEDSAKNLDKHAERVLKALNVPGAGMATTNKKKTHRGRWLEAANL